MTVTAFLKLGQSMIESIDRVGLVWQPIAVKWCWLAWLMTFALATMAWSGSATAQESRTWTDKSGKFKVEATVKEVKKDAVVLIMSDGTEKTIPLSQLSEEDRNYANDLRETMLAEDAAKKKEKADAKAEANKRGKGLEDDLTGVLESFTQSEEQLKQANQDEDKFRVARQPLVQETSQKLLELVKDVPETNVARDVYLWVVRNGATGGPNTTATEMLVEHFPDLPELAPILDSVAQDLPVLEKLVEKSKNKTVKGVGSFLIAEQLAKQNDPALEDRIKELLKQVRSKYSKVVGSDRKPLGPQAEKLLYVLEHLSVGKVAPDISGVDLDGVRFKLSDYRGKVVVVDFWADW